MSPILRIWMMSFPRHIFGLYWQFRDHIAPLPCHYRPRVTSTPICLSSPHVTYLPNKNIARNSGNPEVSMEESAKLYIKGPLIYISFNYKIELILCYSLFCEDCWQSGYWRPCILLSQLKFLLLHHPWLLLSPSNFFYWWK